MRQGSSPKWCYEINARASCESSYVSEASLGEFRPCEWEESNSKCKGADSTLRCTPKRGHALTGDSIATCEDLKLLGPNPWFYSWGRLPPGSGYETCAGSADSGFVPMWWGKWGIDTKEVWGNAAAGLGFNEPDNDVESHVDPADAAALWPQIEHKASDSGISRLGSPVTTTPTVTDGNKQMKWYDDFFAACAGCKVDFLAVHMYKTSVPATMQTLQALHERYGLPIWLTEFNKGGRWTGKSAAEHLAYMREIVPLLEEASYIERYAWMSARNTLWPIPTLIDDATGQLTELGQVYHDLPFNVGK